MGSIPFLNNITTFIVALIDRVSCLTSFATRKHLVFTDLFDYGILCGKKLAASMGVFRRDCEDVECTMGKALCGEL